MGLIVHLLLFGCLCCFKIVVDIVAENPQTSMWETHLVRRAVDTQITMATLEARTLVRCSFSCSTTLGVEAVSLFFVQETNTCYCNSDIDSSPEEASANEIVYGLLRAFYKEEKYMHQVKYTIWPYPSDCRTLYAANHTQDAVYRIDPTGGAVTDTWCDMNNGGWTVIQRRKDGSEDFYRGWTDYVNGFGNRTGEYWLGLENIHHLTQAGSHLEIFMEAFPGVNPPSMTARYTNFVVGDGSSDYSLHVSGYSGDCGDSFIPQSGWRFTTFDNDNDNAITYNCAVRFRGAWWHRGCFRSSLNGYYFQPGEYSHENTFAEGLHWLDCWNFTKSAKSTVMKVRAP